MPVPQERLGANGTDSSAPKATQLFDGRMIFRARGWRLGVILLCIATAACPVFLLLSRHRAARRSGLSSASTSSDSNHSLRLKGMTEAVEKRAIQTPMLAGERSGTLTIVKLTPAGTVVKRGDLLVEYDRQAQLRDFLDRQATNNDLISKVSAAEQNEDAARAKDQTEMKAAEDNLGKAELEIQKVEILSRIDTEKAQENLDEAKATLAQLQQTYELKRKAAQASIRILQIQLDRNRETMAHAEANAALLEVHSPLDGVVVLNTIYKQGTMGEVQEGDQVRSGVAFMQVVDPSRMDVQVSVNQEDLLSLRIGQTASVHLDAYPALEFSAHFDSASPVAASALGSPLKTFAARYVLDSRDPHLLPDLTAAADILPPEVGAK